MGKYVEFKECGALLQRFHPLENKSLFSVMSWNAFTVPSEISFASCLGNDSKMLWLFASKLYNKKTKKFYTAFLEFVGVLS